MTAMTPLPHDGEPITTMQVREATVTLSGVSRRFGERLAVEGVDLTLHAGECIGLVGHNGAGKSTLIKLMLGLIDPSAGHLRVLGSEPGRRAAAPSRAAIGYLPENVALGPSLTGDETLAFYARLKGLPLRANAEILDRVGLIEARHTVASAPIPRACGSGWGWRKRCSGVRA